MLLFVLNVCTVLTKTVCAKLRFKKELITKLSFVLVK